MSGAWAPHGQETKPYPKEWLKRREAYISNSMKWAQENGSLMSFELWCVATGYDPSAHDGGSVFQQLMNYLLVSGHGNLPPNSALVSKYYTLDGKGPEWSKGHKGKLTGLKKENAALAMHSPVSQGAHSKRGGAQGHLSGESVGFYYPFGTGSQRTQSTTWQANVARWPCSKLNWLQSIAAKQTESRMVTGKKASNSSEVQFATVGTTGNCNELEGCMATANLTAAIFGLYFYPKCNDAENNWTVTQRIGNTEYRVRMRMWNPNYTPVTNGRLLVSEPLNKEAKWPSALGRRVVGGRTESVGELGFLFPDVFQEMRSSKAYPLEPAKLIRATEDLTRLAPFFGNVKPANTIGAAAPHFRSVCERLSSAWSTLVHKPDKAYFGFNVPKAHWLYPHHVPSSAEIASTGTRVRVHASTVDTYGASGPVQAWPTFKGVSAEQVMAQEVTKYYEFFDWPDLESMSDEQRRNHALAPTMPPTSQAPSQVQTVQVPAAPPAPPQPQMGEQTVELDPMETTTDGTEQESADASRREAALDIGFVKDSALNIESQGAMLEGEGGGYEMGIETDNDKLRKGFNKLAGYNANTKEVNALTPGARENARTDLNPHWYSARHQPWPHRDLYDVSGLSLKVGEVLGESKLREYERDYGSTHNLYLRGEKTPKKIDGIEQQFGFAKDVVHTALSANTTLHQRHMCRILAIFFYDGEIGTENGGRISAANKREGMLHGVWSTETAGTQTDAHVHYGKQKSGYVQLWPPVFTKTPDRRWAKWFDLDLMRGDNNELHDCLVADKLAKIKSVCSEMTVLQWVTSPWHYAFLPYQPQSILFNDGETYSEGCLRCARPFYEFEEMYAWYRLSADKTQHWPTGYWTMDPSGNPCGRACAPVPFHDKRFWSREQVRSDPPRNAAKDHLGVDEDGGWHNWPTFAFELSEKSRYLKGEFSSRKETLKKSGVMSKISRAEPLTFRRYLNHVWDPDRVEYWGGDYATYAQGRLSRGKVQMGMREYKLTRASKYGNTCRDCAAVLELAPGLFHRNHRTVYDVGMVVGNKKQHKTAETWWTNLIHRVGGEGMLNFDPDAMHTKPRLSEMSAEQKAGYLRSFDDSMSIYAKYLGEQHDVALGSSTKFKEPPDIYIQKAVPDMTDSTKSKDHELIKEAIADLRVMLDQPPSSWKINTKNKAFRDMVYELERKYTHKERFKWREGTKVFDSEMMRLEIRNDERVYEKKTYRNCLVTRLYQPQGPAMGGLRPPEEDYVEHVYYATRHGAMGECETAVPTMWCGDGYVTRYDAKKGYWVDAPPRVNNPIRQWRKMRQSRLFITYSLHRAVTSEHEGRLLMERMADAAHELFGNDANLSELLVFGYKLGGFSARGETTDTISKAQFELIQGPNKKDAVRDFYGEPNASSYQYDTYETHVEKVEVDGGIEIGPNRHHPHFHILVTVNHWSYIQIDYFKMNAYLELMFRGLDPLERGWGDRFKLLDASGGLFYTDNENPHVDIKLYPQDNWQDIINAYVRKNATPGIMESLSARTGGT